MVNYSYFTNEYILWERVFQIVTTNVTSTIVEILDFFFLIVMVVFETLQKNQIFKTVFVNVH